jgi:tRNA G37 N-methylase TrmD
MRLISVLALASAGQIVFAQQQAQQLATSRDLSISCLVYEGLSFYDLRKLQNPEIDYNV